MSLISEGLNRIWYGKKPKLAKSIQRDLITFDRKALNHVATRLSERIPVTYGTCFVNLHYRDMKLNEEGKLKERINR